MARDEPPTVLVVDDEAEVADAYAAKLGDAYIVRAVYDAEAALEALDDSISVVLLDRRLPDSSGEAVLSAIRERGLSARVAMVTAVEPDFEIIDMPFDDYILKPVTTADIRETVDRLARCVAYTERLREYYSLTAKHATLTASKSEAELADSDEFAALERRLDSVQAELAELADGFADGDFETVFKDFDESGGQPIDAP